MQVLVIKDGEGKFVDFSDETLTKMGGVEAFSKTSTKLPDGSDLIIPVGTLPGEENLFHRGRSQVTTIN